MLAGLGRATGKIIILSSGVHGELRNNTDREQAARIRLSKETYVVCKYVDRKIIFSA